jgi:hypothetical protein
MCAGTIMKVSDASKYVPLHLYHALSHTKSTMLSDTANLMHASWQTELRQGVSPHKPRQWPRDAFELAAREEANLLTTSCWRLTAAALPHFSVPIVGTFDRSAHQKVCTKPLSGLPHCPSFRCAGAA